MSFIIELLTVCKLWVIIVEIQGDLNMLTLVDILLQGLLIMKH